MDDATKPACHAFQMTEILLEHRRPKLTLREWHVIYFLTSQCRVTGDLWNPGGTPHTKGVGMLVGKFELNP